MKPTLLLNEAEEEYSIEDGLSSIVDFIIIGDVGIGLDDGLRSLEFLLVVGVELV